MSKLKYNISLALLACSSLTFAGSMGDAMANASTSNWFVGLGGGYNSVQLTQSLYAIGDATFTGLLTGSGTAEGPAPTYHGTVNVFSPQVQTGWVKHFANNDHFWGIKFSYQYLGAVVNHDSFTALQIGSVGSKQLVGNLLIGSTETTLNHELLLLPFIGHSFKHSNVYFGMGPSLFGTHSALHNLTGFANFGTPTDVTGLPVSFANTNWMWGGAAQIGAAYFLTSDWSVNLDYTYAISGQYTNKNSGPFVNRLEGLGVTVTGTGYVNTKQSMSAQALTLTINKLF